MNYFLLQGIQSTVRTGSSCAKDFAPLFCFWGPAIRGRIFRIKKIKFSPHSEEPTRGEKVVNV